VAGACQHSRSSLAASGHPTRRSGGGGPFELSHPAADPSRPSRARTSSSTTTASSGLPAAEHCESPHAAFFIDWLEHIRPDPGGRWQRPVQLSTLLARRTAVRRRPSAGALRGNPVQRPASRTRGQAPRGREQGRFVSARRAARSPRERGRNMSCRDAAPVSLPTLRFCGCGLEWGAVGVVDGSRRGASLAAPLIGYIAVNYERDYLGSTASASST